MSPWMHVAGWVLVHFVWQGAAVAIVAAIALRLCRRQSASVRYGIACGALVAMLAGIALTGVVIDPPAQETQSLRVSARTGSDGRADVLLPIQISESAPE